MMNRNRYCSRCMQTRRFHNAEDIMVCEHCRKTLVKVPVLRR